MPDVPDWLGIIRGSHEWQLAPRPDGAGLVERPYPGDIRAARHMDARGDTLARLVVVLDVDDDERIASVALTTDELDLATDADVEIPSELAGTAFRLLAQPGIVGPVWWGQLGPLVGRVQPEVLGPDTSLRRGLPLRSRTDGRWLFKEQELLELRSLTSECMESLCDGAREVRAFVDPQMISGWLEGGDPRVADLLSEEGRPRFNALPSCAALALNVETVALSLDPDLLNVVQALLQESLVATTSEPGLDDVVDDWHPERRIDCAADQLGSVVAGCTRRHIHSIRLATSRELWTEAAVEIYAAETTCGRIQVIPEPI